MTGLFRVFDAAYPPAQAPPGCQGVLGYIGGQRATNVWHLTEWQRFAHLVQFPAYVPDFTRELPVQAAQAACYDARMFGWAPFQPARRVIVCDLETLQERAWYASFAAECEQQGFTAVAYGSESTIFETAAAEVVVAGWDGTADLLPGQTVHGHQYQANVPSGGTVVDFSVFDDWLFARGGVGPRHQ
jgi:hypothetical protein